MDFFKTMNTETGNMSSKKFTDFFQNQLIPACNEQWGKGCYLIMMCDSPDLVIAPLCEECGLPSVLDRYYFEISHELLNSGMDIKEIVLIDDYNDNGYGLIASRKVEDCCCFDEDEDDEDYEDDEDDEDEN